MTVRSIITLVFALIFIGVGDVYGQQKVKIVGGKRFEVVDSAALHKADSLARVDSLFRADSLAGKIDTTLLKGDPKKNIKKESKKSRELEMLNGELAKRAQFKLTRDTISAGALVGLSVVPGLGQIYNKQYWKAPVFLLAGGAFLTGGLVTDSKYKSYKEQWQNAIDLSLPNEIVDPLTRKMRQAGSTRTIFYALAGATYLYQLADATYNYRGYQNPVRTATIMAALFPGAGFIYTKTYWRLPIYYGGFAVLATVVDYNARNYERYNRAYLAVADGDPGTKDEFNGRYSADVLKNAKDAYRRNRDLGIIGLVGAYALSIIDTYVIATLKNWDVSPDLSFRIEPTLFDEQVYRATTPRPQSAGMSLKITF